MKIKYHIPIIDIFNIKTRTSVTLLIRYSNSFVMGRDSSVGIATRYDLDRTGIESRWERDFPHPSRPVLWPTQPIHSRG